MVSETTLIDTGHLSTHRLKELNVVTNKVFFKNEAQLIDNAGFFNTANVWLVKVNNILISNTASLSDILLSLEDEYGIKFISQKLWNISTADVEIYIEYTGSYVSGIPALTGPTIFTSHRDNGSVAPIAKAVTLLIGCSSSVQLTTYPPYMTAYEHAQLSPKRWDESIPAVAIEGNRYILNVNGIEYKDNRDNTVTPWTGDETRGSLEDIFSQNSYLSTILSLNYAYNDFDLNAYSAITNISEEVLEIKYYLDLENSTRPIQAAGDIADCVYNRATYYNGKSTITWDLEQYPNISNDGFQCNLYPANSKPVVGIVSPNLIGVTVQWADLTAALSKDIILNVVDGATVITQMRYRKNEEAWVVLASVLPPPSVEVGPVASYPVTIQSEGGFISGDMLSVELTSSLNEVVVASIKYP